MKWVYKEPALGDMIRVDMGGLYHFGIYVSDEEVIQFGLPPRSRIGVRDADVEVLAADIDAFLAGGFLEVCEFDKKEKKKNRTPSEIVEYARGKIGTKGYHILYNNCEHFANECVTGTAICRQAEDVRALFRNMPIVDVYIAKIPENAPLGVLDCKLRMQDIEAVNNEKVKREKYFVWKLLTYALERSFGKRGTGVSFKKESYGGWSAGEFEISLSHSGSALAVAVSKAPVGIDIERIRVRSSEKFAEHILTPSELSEFENVSEDKRDAYLIGKWTAKEAIFKSRKQETFIPRNIDTSTENVKTDSTFIDGEEFIWSVASATPERIRIFTNIDLS